MKRDAEQVFSFASLQGQTARQQLPATASDLRSVVLWTQGQMFERSDAVLMVLQQLGGPWTLMGALWVLPRWLRDAVYFLVAKNRYRVFGKRETCRLPTPEERARFLD